MEDINRVQEEIIKSDIKKDEKLWKEINCNNSLEELLDKMTKDELVKVSKKYSLRGLTSLKKAEVVARIETEITEKCSNMIAIATEESLVFLKNILMNNGVIKYNCHDIVYANFWRNRGMVFTILVNDEPTLVIPNELREVLNNKLTKDEIRIAQENSNIIKAIAGMSFYYGVVEYNILKAMVERVCTKNMEDNELKTLICLGEELGYDYIVSDKFVVTHIDVEDEEKMLSLQNESNVEYNMFDKKTLIEAGKQDYLGLNKQGQKLTKVLGELFVIDKEILKEEMDGLQVAIKNNMNELEAIDIFLESYQIESEEERKILVDELKIYAKTIRKWSLKGHTEDEVEKTNSRVVNIIKIGRNDPCICGSGKKYKKCCG